MQWMCVIAVCWSVVPLTQSSGVLHTHRNAHTHQAQYSSFDIVLCALSSAMVTTSTLYRDDRMKMSSRRNFLHSPKNVSGHRLWVSGRRTVYESGTISLREDAWPIIHAVASKHHIDRVNCTQRWFIIFFARANLHCCRRHWSCANYSPQNH